MEDAGAHIYEEPAVVVLVVGHEGVVGDGAAKAQQHGGDVLVECSPGQGPWLQHAGAEQ